MTIILRICLDDVPLFHPTKKYVQRRLLATDPVGYCEQTWALASVSSVSERTVLAALLWELFQPSREALSLLFMSFICFVTSSTVAVLSCETSVSSLSMSSSTSPDPSPV
jgi:hypothetical protein